MIELIAQERRTPPALSVRRMCRVLKLGRATYYRARGPGTARERDGALRRQLRRLALAWPAYGYRRLAYALRRHGVVANPKRVLRLMREEQLIARRRRRFRCTTDSRHGYLLYPNLVPQLRVSGLNQLWIAEITQS